MIKKILSIFLVAVLLAGSFFIGNMLPRNEAYAEEYGMQLNTLYKNGDLVTAYENSTFICEVPGTYSIELCGSDGGKGADHGSSNGTGIGGSGGNPRAICGEITLNKGDALYLTFIPGASSVFGGYSSSGGGGIGVYASLSSADTTTAIMIAGGGGGGGGAYGIGPSNGGTGGTVSVTPLYITYGEWPNGAGSGGSGAPGNDSYRTGYKGGPDSMGGTGGTGGSKQGGGGGGAGRNAVCLDYISNVVSKDAESCTTAYATITLIDDGSFTGEGANIANAIITQGNTISEAIKGSGNSSTDEAPDVITVIAGIEFTLQVKGYKNTIGGTADGITVINNDLSDSYITIIGKIETAGDYSVVIDNCKYVFRAIEEPNSTNVTVLLN